MDKRFLTINLGLTLQRQTRSFGVSSRRKCLGQRSPLGFGLGTGRNIATVVVGLILCLASLGNAESIPAELPKPKIEHKEVMYKDLTGDGQEEKLVFSYSGPELIHLDVAFRIYQIDPQSKAEKEIFNEEWDTWDIYNDVHGPDYSIDKVKAYITDFFADMCFDYSKNKLCQTKCLGSLWCTEEEIRGQIRHPMQVKKLKEQMGKKEYEEWYEAVTQMKYWSDEYNKKIRSVKVDEKEVDKIFQEIFMEKDITCFSYEPYPELLEMFVWSSSQQRFISVGGCH